VAGGTAPSVVHQVLARPGRQLDGESRSFFEPKFGASLGHVRLHDDALASASARALGAVAYTVGHDITVASPLRSGNVADRLLLAHELTHTIQQSNRRSPFVQRQLSTTPPDSQAQKDPQCPADKPYRLGPKPGPGEADPAMVPVCSAIPPPKAQNLLTPDNPSQPQQQDPPPQPKANEPTPSNPPSTTPTDPSQKAQEPSQPAADPGQPKATPAAKDGYGYDFSDDPLSAGGFGPNDATIRVRPGPVRTDIIRPRGIQWTCGSPEESQVATFGPKDVVNVQDLAGDLKNLLASCPSAAVMVDAVPDRTEDDGEGKALQRAQAVENKLIDAVGHQWESRFDYAFGAGNPGEVQVKVRRKAPLGGGPDVAPKVDDQKPTPKTSDQVSAQAGAGDVRHFYTAASGSAALHELLTQVTGAYTKVLHKKDESGEERQAFATVQYSETTKQWTVLFGVQDSYVLQLPANFQLSFWAQLSAGTNLTAGVSQGALSAGSQLTWQPADWLAFGAQAGLGPTIQASGPSSVDRTGLIFFQIQK
jgi:hypothetical protein